MLRMYRVDYIFKEDGYTYTGEWYSENVQAESENEAIELIKQCIDENGGDSSMFVYVAKCQRRRTNMKEYVICFSENVEDSVVKSRKIDAKSFEDAVEIVQKELIDEGKDPCVYFYSSYCANDMYICRRGLK